MLWCNEPLEKLKFICEILDSVHLLKGGALINSIYYYVYIYIHHYCFILLVSTWRSYNIITYS